MEMTEIIYKWIDFKPKDINKKLPKLMIDNPTGYNCGYNIDYKQCLLELDRLLEEEN